MARPSEPEGACGNLRQGADRFAGGPSPCRRRRRRRRRAPSPLGAALPARHTRAGASRRPRRPPITFRHRSLRTGPVDRRTDQGHDQHRRRAVPRAGVLRVQRRSRRAAPAVDPRPRRAARTPRVDQQVGHIRCAARGPRRRPGRRTTRAGAAATAGRRDSSRSRRETPRAGFHRHDLASAGLTPAGRRCRGRAARRRGAGGPDHNPVGHGADHPHAAAPGAARVRR